ncbi:coiled-coil domain-containing protein [Allosalinactinospora lopnorensis]|uniref:hypothetical protein n=1 Tax=Allosalinactinospora lopnorensis TaxID=1352348 RepID=UPI000623BDC6|nr:hypothetical protein [Allosalinactinospora lopnorensis]
MNEHSTEILPNLLREDAFPTVRKGGYDKRQVDDFVVRNHNQIRDLQERLARAHDELEQLRRELAEVKEKAAEKPEHEQISARMAEILRIAEEEAKDKRSKIDDEVESIRKKAEEAANKRVKDAEEHAERVVSSARSEATEMVSGAKKEAEQLRSQAKQDSERRVSDAEVRAKKINDTADRRLATLTATHDEAVRRLGDMHGTLAELLRAEKEAGPLETGLSQEEVEAEQNANSSDDASTAQPAKGQDGQGGAAASKGASAAQQSAPQGKSGKAAQEVQEEGEQTVKLDPSSTEQGGDSTVKFDSGAADGSETQQKMASQPVRNTPSRPPQGARVDAPAPEEAVQQPGQAAGGPGITGVYRAPEGQIPQKPMNSEATEGVRIIRP